MDFVDKEERLYNIPAISKNFIKLIINGGNENGDSQDNEGAGCLW